MDDWRRRFPPELRGSAALLAAMLVLAGCSGAGTSAARPSDAAPVEAATVAKKSMPLELRAVGNVEARSSVEVRARVAGQILSVHFAEGQHVRKGDLLFRIDPRPYEAVLRQAEAALARDRALQKNAEVEAKRFEGLIRDGIVTQEQHDEAHAQAESMRATVAADEAAVERARLDLGFCSVTAPIAGRAGAILVHPGNLVGPSTDALVVLLQTRPIYVTFSVPERELAAIRARSASGPLEVEALASGTQAGSRGTLSFVDNTVNTATGTIQLKATFPNDDGALWPGQFVDVLLRLAVENDVLVVPLPAILEGQAGTYVYVVKPDFTAETRPVEVQRSVGQEAIVARGLAEGERVVTDGQLRLAQGTRVEIKGAAGEKE
jgi:multidrug efflux system membrane fusion protein